MSASLGPVVSSAAIGWHDPPLCPAGAEPLPFKDLQGVLEIDPGCQPGLTVRQIGC